MRDIVFELCAETVEAALAARDGGAARIELCSGLEEGGITPSHALIRAAIEQSALPIHVLVRPRGGDFLYSIAELAILRDDIAHVKSLGAAGVVFGVLSPDNTVDIPRTRSLVELARPMRVTFHRAFDATPSLPAALEDVIDTGCDRVLTSGGQPDVVAGAEALAALILQARKRIDIAVGGGLRLQNATEISSRTGATHFHGSLRSHSAAPSSVGEGISNPNRAGLSYVVEASTIRAIIHRLQNA